MTAIPKPAGAIARALDFNRGGEVLDLTPIERQLLRDIIDNADLLDVVTSSDSGYETDRWLLVRAPPWLLELMATFEAEREDLEGDEREPDVDDELGVDQEDIDEREPDDSDHHYPPSPRDIVPARQLRRARPSKPPQIRRPAVPTTHHADLSEWRKL